MAKILFIIPYDFYPARYGGALRCFHLLKEAARENEVTLLTVQPAKDFSNNCIHGFPKDARVESTFNQPEYKTIFNFLPQGMARAVNSRILQRSLRKKGNLYLLKTYPLLKEIIQSNSFDAVIYENLECFSVLRAHIKKWSPYTRHIYDAHNVDSELWKAQAQSLQNPVLKKYGLSALKEESNLYKTADLCFCCSEIDKEKLQQLNKGQLQITVVPNGVDTRLKAFDTNPGKFNIKNILFCGTLDYAPNKKGLLWFCEKVFPLVQEKVPDMRLTIIGKLNNNDPYATIRNRPGIDFIGPVEDVSKYYNESSVAIVPLLQGSGTRLKIMEAMSFGNPVVSTGVGAEGLNLTNGNNILIADSPEDFVDKIIQLTENKNLYQEIRQNANDLVRKEYDWAVIGAKMNGAIEKILHP